MDPGARVAYVDDDWVVTDYFAALMKDQGVGGVAVVSADLRKPARVLADPGLREVIDLGEPVCVLLAAVLPPRRRCRRGEARRGAHRSDIAT